MNLLNQGRKVDIRLSEAVSLVGHDIKITNTRIFTQAKFG